MISKMKIWMRDLQSGARTTTAGIPHIQEKINNLNKEMVALRKDLQKIALGTPAPQTGTAALHAPQEQPDSRKHRVVLKVDKEQWSGTAQPGELSFHRTSTFRADHEKFTAANARFFDGFGFSATQFTGKTIVDLGAGSKLRALYFTGANIIAIEPLAEKFMQEIEWCDLRKASEVYSAPAEAMIDGLAGRVDFLFSINVLDHCYDFVDCIANIYAYLKPGGTAFLAFDCHQKTDDLHPIIVNEKVASAAMFDAGFQIDKLERIASFHRGIAAYAIALYLTKPKGDQV